MRFKLMALAAATILTVPAVAQTTDPTAPAAKPKPKKEKKICRSAEPNSYSRMTATVCRTQAEWDRNPDIGNTGSSNVRSGSGDDLGSR